MPAARAQRYVVNAISQMSKASVRTIGRMPFVVIGSTSTKSSATPHGTAFSFKGRVRP